MLIVGELINSSRKAIKEAIENYDAETIKDVAKAQADGGADYIDINCGTFVQDEEKRSRFLIDTVREVTDLPLCLDSPDPKVLEAGLMAAGGQKQPMINSITWEKERFAAILPLVLQYKAKIIALCMGDGGIPQTASERVEIAKQLVAALTDAGVAEDDIYLDPLVQPVSSADNAGIQTLDTISGIKNIFPDVHCICGLSNISFGLPNRKLLNRIFLVQAMSRGMDAYILNPTDVDLMGTLYASNALLGRDRFCGKYLKAHRKGLYEKK